MGSSKVRRRARAFLAVSSAFVLGACGSARERPPAARPVASASVATTSAATSSSSLAPRRFVPAVRLTVDAKPFVRPTVRWVFWPEDLRARRAVAVGDGTSLFVGELGERWLAAPDGSRRRSAETFAREALSAARQRKDGWLFAGRSGAVYAAPGALADFATVRAPATPMRATALGKEALLGVLADGEVVRSVDEGATWLTTDLPRTSGKAIDVALTPTGLGAVLASSGELFVTRDDGASFERAATVPDARSLSVSPAGALIVRVAVARGRRFEYRRLDPDGSLAPADRPSPLRLPTSPGQKDDPDYGAHHAAKTTAAHFVELRGGRAEDEDEDEREDEDDDDDEARRPGPAHVPSALRGTIGLLSQPLPEGARSFVPLTESWSIWDHFDAAGSMRVLVDDGQVRVSEDAGARWTKTDSLKLDDGALGMRGVWTTPRGAILAAGYCRAKGETCLTHGALGTATPRGRLMPVFPATVPADLAIEAFVFSATGDRIFARALSIPRESDAPGLAGWSIVSRDGGAHWTVKRVPGEVSLFGSPSTVDESDPKHPHVVSLVRGERLEWNDDFTAFTEAPCARKPLRASFAGARGLLLESADGPLFETEDAGRTWTAVEHPPSARFECVALGCRFQGGAFRAGWALASKPPPSTP